MPPLTLSNLVVLLAGIGVGMLLQSVQAPQSRWSAIGKQHADVQAAQASSSLAPLDQEATTKLAQKHQLQRAPAPDLDPGELKPGEVLLYSVRLLADDEASMLTKADVARSPCCEEPH